MVVRKQSATPQGRNGAGKNQDGTVGGGLTEGEESPRRRRRKDERSKKMYPLRQWMDANTHRQTKGREKKHGQENEERKEETSAPPSEEPNKAEESTEDPVRLG